MTGLLPVFSSLVFDLVVFALPLLHTSFFSIFFNRLTWVRVIQNASILQIRPQDPWTKNEALIQVRTVQEQDLESKVDLPESEHEYEDTFDVIKLPLPIPTVVQTFYSFVQMNMPYSSASENTISVF